MKSSNGFILCLALAQFACHASDPGAIELENDRTGNESWAPRRGHEGHEVEGYALRSSIQVGETLPVAISAAKGPEQLDWRVFRLGHYRGRGGRELASGKLVASPQPACPMHPETGLITCGWTPNLRIATGPGWTRGVYVVRLVRANGREAYVPFVLRDDRARAEVLVVLPTATWQAYNFWGDESLYTDGSGKLGGHATKVSYDRPYVEDSGAGQLFRRDRSLVQWVESQHLDVAYATSEDVDRDPAIFDGVKAVLISSHDEYWTGNQRRRLDAAVARGTSLLLLGANAGYWQTRMEPAADGRDRRTLVCFKDNGRGLDPVGPESPDLSTRFRDLGHPESLLFGVQYMEGWSWHPGPQVVVNPAHWAFAGTGLRKGDLLWRANGYEIDQLVGPGSSPTGLEVLTDSPSLSYFGEPRSGQMVIREQGKAIVFAAGGTDFLGTLGSFESFDPRASRLVANVLYRALGREVPGHLPIFPRRDQAPPAGGPARSVTLLAGVPGVRADVDGRKGEGKLIAPGPIALLPGGVVVVSDLGARKLRLISTDGTLSTLPLRGVGRVMGLVADAEGNLYASDSSGDLYGDALDDRHRAVVRISRLGEVKRLAGGEVGAADGPGALARFRDPAGLALSPDGSRLYVADTGNHSVRAIDLRDPAFTVTTVAAGHGFPTAVVARADGGLVFAESREQQLFEVRDGVVHLLAGGGEGYQDGGSLGARTAFQLGMTLLPDGTIALADTGNYRVRRLVGGSMETLTGGETLGHHGAEGALVLPAGLVAAPDGRLFVSEAGSGTVRVIEP